LDLGGLRQQGAVVVSIPASGGGWKGLFGVSTDMGIAEAGINGVLNLAGWGGLGAGWNVWVVTRQVSTRPLCH
jgi:hypothetical protein